MRTFILLCTVFLLMGVGVVGKEVMVKRTIITPFLKGKDVPANEFSNMARFVEMPLNYLGLKVEYYDVSSGKFPDLSNRDDIRGIATWFLEGESVPNAEFYIHWLRRQVDDGKKLLIIGNPGFLELSNGPTPAYLTNRVWKKLGLKYTGTTKQFSKTMHLVQNKRRYFGFETPFSKIKPAFMVFDIVSPDLLSYLDVEESNNFFPLMTNSANGGFIAEGYICDFSPSEDRQEWYINIFRFLEDVFELHDTPRPDVTTVAGRRIYFSHIDGDGWLSRTQIEKYRKNPPLTPKVILDEIIKPHPELPLTIGPVVAEIDPKWYGTPESLALAKKIFSYPQIEVATHTVSHPLLWSYFENEKRGNIQEKAFAKIYKEKHGHDETMSGWFVSLLKKKKKHYAISEGLGEDYDTPRAYGKYPFSLKDEIKGGVDFVNALCPEGKKAGILLWSGNCVPFEAAVAETRKIGILNMNGGDGRFDREFPSYTWEPPIGRSVGKERQIYAVCSNENTYTNLWQDHFYGQIYLWQTWYNSGIPRRIKPLNLYYHMYSGERTASLRGLLSNIRYANKCDICPVKASRYASIATSFYSTEFIVLDKNKWKLKSHGALDTIRFDHALFKAVDYKNSLGIVGERHALGDLYIYLDRLVKEPIITLKTNKTYWREPKESCFYLIDSRVEVWGLKRESKNKITFFSRGFGIGEMTWNVPKSGTYIVRMDNWSERIVSYNQQIKFSLPQRTDERLQVFITKE